MCCFSILVVSLIFDFINFSFLIQFYLFCNTDNRYTELPSIIIRF